VELGSLGSNVALLAAVLDLSEVQSVVRAMRTVDQPGKNNPVLSLNPEPRPVIQPEPRYEPRRVIHPTPRYERRPIIHPEPRIEQKLNDCSGDGSSRPVVVVKAAEAESPLQPPWKTVPWKSPLQPAPKVKVACYHPDIIRRGTLLDLLV